MSPIGGVGINLAIQDAVAAANELAAPLAKGAVSDDHLRKIQSRREFPTRVTQGFQVFAHRRFLGPAMRHSRPITSLPFALKLLQMFPILRRIPARLVGMGVRPEHVRTPDTQAQSSRQN
jgi:2-polyprenyl-6-methoxyphenol hydroxylase-like FAD-dependent oxidoreductase